MDRSERTTSQKAGRRSRLFDRAVLKDFDEVEYEDEMCIRDSLLSLDIMGRLFII